MNLKFIWMNHRLLHSYKKTFLLLRIMRTIAQSIQPKKPLRLLLVLSAAFSMLAIMAPTAVFANPGLDSSCDASNPGCTTVTITAGATVSVLYDHAWDAPVCSAANSVGGHCTLCVWTSASLTDVAHVCSSDGSLSLTSNNGFTFSGAALHEFITIPIGGV